MYASDFLFFTIMLLLLVLMGFITIYDHMSDHNWEKSHHRTLRNRLEDATKTVDVVKVKNNPCCMARTKVCMACEMGITIATFCEKIAPLHKEDFGCDDSTTLSHTSKNEPEMIITSVYNYKKDPQRFMKVNCNFDYIANFYNSIVFYKLNAVIMHDCFSKEFIDRFSTSNIKFVKVNANKDMSTNDFRFVQYNKYIEQHISPYYMFVDASDVFFNGNPFNYMKRNEHGHTLFMSPDYGMFHKNAWQVKKCYNRAGELWDQNVKMHNAGVWGGDYHMSKCILECVVNQLTTTLKGRGNCNMPALNWCVHFGDCTYENTVEDQPDFVNPFRKKCRGDHLIIHNKCKDTEGKTCLVRQNDKLVLSKKISQCEKLILKKKNCVKSIQTLCPLMKGEHCYEKKYTHGIASTVYLMKDNTVVKKALTTNQYVRELETYKYLKKHNSTWISPELLGVDINNRCFRLENGGVNLHGVQPTIETLHSLKLIIEQMKKINLSHNDLSLEEVLVDTHGNVKIIDFGWSSFTGVSAMPKERTFKDETILQRVKFMIEPPLGSELHVIVHWVSKERDIVLRRLQEHKSLEIFAMIEFKYASTQTLDAFYAPQHAIHGNKGKVPFLLIVVIDKRPKYVFKEVRGCEVLVNKNTYDFKHSIRRGRGGFIHSSDNLEESYTNLRALSPSKKHAPFIYWTLWRSKIKSSSPHNFVPNCTKIAGTRPNDKEKISKTQSTILSWLESMSSCTKVVAWKIDRDDFLSSITMNKDIDIFVESIENAVKCLPLSATRKGTKIVAPGITGLHMYDHVPSTNLPGIKMPLLNNIFADSIIVASFPTLRTTSLEHACILRWLEYHKNKKRKGKHLVWTQKHCFHPFTKARIRWGDLTPGPIGNTVNCVVEISKGSTSKYEIDTEFIDSPLNVSRVLEKPIPVNYGFIPQTYVSPDAQWYGQNGDGDPLDCIVIGEPINTGTVVPVTVLGVLEFYDSGKMDWKIITQAKKSGVLDIKMLRDWFNSYKVQNIKVALKFDYGNEDIANSLIRQTHGYWRHTTISLVVPAIKDDISFLHELNTNIKYQLRKPDEIIVILSGTSQKDCVKIEGWTIECFDEKIHQGEARNIGWDMASSDIVSFMDADDTMYPERIEIIHKMFNKNKNLKLLVHEFDRFKSSDFRLNSMRQHNINSNPDIDDGHMLYITMKKTQGKQLHLRIDLAHGHVSIQKNIHCPKFVSKVGEDSIFVRKCVQTIGDNKEAMAFVRHPLSHYIPRANILKRREKLKPTPVE